MVSMGKERLRDSCVVSGKLKTDAGLLILMRKVRAWSGEAPVPD